MVELVQLHLFQAHLLHEQVVEAVEQMLLTGLQLREVPLVVAGQVEHQEVKMQVMLQLQILVVAVVVRQQ